MKKITSFLLSAAMIAGSAQIIVVGSATTAKAVTCAPCIQVTRAEHQYTRGLIRSEHQSTRNNLIEALREQTDNLIQALQGTTSELGSRTDRTVESQRRLMDAAEQNATFRQRQQFRAEAESGKFDPHPFLCSLIDLNRPTGGAPPSITGAQSVEAQAAFYSGNGRLSEEVKTGGVALNRAISQERARITNNFDPAVSTSPTTDFSLIFRHPTIPLDNQEYADAIEWQVNNLYGPPPQPITPEELNTPTGQAESVRRDQIAAMQSAGRQSLSFATNLRTPRPIDAQRLRDLAAGSGYNQVIGDQVSELQQLEIRTVAAYAPSPDRLTRLDNMNERNLMAELIMQLSLTNRLLYLQLEGQQRDAATQAAILAAVMPAPERIARN